MGKPVLVIAETDESYLSPLEMKIAFSLSDTVAIEILSEESAFEAFFSQPRTIDILVIDEKLYSSDLYCQSIKKTFILVEELEDVQDEDYSQKSEVRLFKYSNLNALYGMIVPTEWGGRAGTAKKGQLLPVISSVGGAGCTSVAVGIAAYLAQNYKKVLYLNSQSMQTFQYYLSNQSKLLRNAMTDIRKANQSYADIKKWFLHDHFDFLPSLETTRHNLGITTEHYSSLAKAAKMSQDYDYVIIDVGTELENGTVELVEEAEKVIVVTRQDAYSAYKTNALAEFFNIGDGEKFLFLCNGYEQDKKNAFSVSARGKINSRIVISEYVEWEDGLSGLAQLTQLKGIQKIGVALL